MKPYEIEFGFNDSSKIIIKLGDSLSEVHSGSRSPIFFVERGKEYLLKSDILPIKNNLEGLILILRKALRNELSLNKSIETSEGLGRDIGYIYNEILQNRFPFTNSENNNDPSDLWIGDKYRVWGYTLQLWLYNDENGDIIFKLTPLFPGGFALGDSTDPEEIERSLQYDAWIKNYKPFLIETLPRETAQRWLAHAEDIMKMIEDNERRMQAEYEAVSK